LTITFILNGQKVAIEAPADRRVVDLLREDFELTGTKQSCGTGDCGACTILVNGESRLSCLMLAAQLQDRTVTTIEALSSGDTLHPLQQAFVEHGAVQCGFCTPGMVMAAADLLTRHPVPSRKEIAEGLAGNLCRCTGYQKIVDAVAIAATQTRGETGMNTTAGQLVSAPCKEAVPAGDSSHGTEEQS
jgi:aerobic carbon-monoxide dehydrogenase small subunit